MVDPLPPREIRRIILEQSKRANVGHIGSCLSVVDIIAALYSGVLRIDSPDSPLRDRFVLSKGHAALALYAALRLKGWLTADRLNTFCGNGSLLGVHPEHQLYGIDFASGSLGHGLGIAAGSALAAKLQKSPSRVFCLISDAECNEGSIWEAVMFAAHHGLNNLTAIVDWNGQQAMGLTRDVINIPNLKERWQAFGWRVSEVDGHSHAQLASAMNAAPESAPHLILARTIFGYNISYMMQGKALTQTHLPDQPINWHYLPMSDEEYRIALSDLESAG